jgi:hypothetical protein
MRAELTIPIGDGEAPARSQLHAPHASTGEPSPHGEVGIAGVAPVPPPELPPPELLPAEPPLDAELAAPVPAVVVLSVAPVPLQYVGVLTADLTCRSTGCLSGRRRCR